MNFVRLGNSGLKISEITFGSALTIGTEHNDVDFAKRMIHTAWDTGIRSFDTANNYGMGKAEELLGEALKEFPRNEFVIATKGSWPIGTSVYDRGLSRKHIFRAIDESLHRLQMDYVDLYYAHRYDPETSMEEICRTFNALITQGKIRYWATSEWPCEALKRCHEVCNQLGLEKPIAEQFIYSYALTKAEHNGVKSFCDEHGMGTLGFSPLCQGFLTGKYRSKIPEDSRIAKSDVIGYHKTKNFYEQNKIRIDYFLETAKKYDVKPSYVALQWCLRHGIYPVVGASRPEQLNENVKALTVSIPDGIWQDLEAMDALR